MHPDVHPIMLTSMQTCPVLSSPGGRLMETSPDGRVAGRVSGRGVCAGAANGGVGPEAGQGLHILLQLTHLVALLIKDGQRLWTKSTRKAPPFVAWHGTSFPRNPSVARQQNSQFTA